jgi:putative transposase
MSFNEVSPMEKIQNKYRIPSARAAWWDYSNNAAYFITICTNGRVHYLGEIVRTTTTSESQLLMSPSGQIAACHWHEIPMHFPFVKLDAFVVMPNHIHGIIIIDKPENVTLNDKATTNDGVTTNDGFVETRLIASLQSESQPQPESEHTDSTQTGGFAGNKNPMLHENLSRIIRWYKGIGAFESRKLCPDFKWQPRFHDHIIRNDAEYQRINDYIENNPANWERDKFFSK